MDGRYHYDRKGGRECSTLTAETHVPSSPAPSLPPLRGVALVVGTAFLFARSDLISKHLMMRYPVSVVQAGRHLVNVLLLLAILARATAPPFGPHGVRGWLRFERCFWRQPA